MMVVSDVDDVFVPLQDGLCVDPIASKHIIEYFLDSLPRMFASNRTTEACMGSACQAAFEALVRFF